MRIVFVSNYINHHQIPFCSAMMQETEGDFTFIQTEPMEKERVLMGWHEEIRPDYVKCYYEDETICKALIQDADVVLFGGCDDERYIEKRLESGKAVIRISERLYKSGQWKAISPKGLLKKYHDHTRYRNAQVYLLCAGAYVPSDFHIVRAYPNKMFVWGYFPETKHYDVEQLLKGKCEDGGEPLILWAARMIDWKHPELAIETAEYLRDQGLRFRMELVGSGVMEAQMKELADEKQLEKYVTFAGALRPEEVRKRMEKADIFLFTSDRQEGWGAVLNESMNSGCAVVADHMIGAAPWLIRQGVNGMVYEDGNRQSLFAAVEKLVRDRKLRLKLGRNAYETIVQTWNAENAARQLMRLVQTEIFGAPLTGADMVKSKLEAGGESLNPCAPAPVVSERKMRKELFS